jgi:hypothetical protein
MQHSTLRVVDGCDSESLASFHLVSGDQKQTVSALKTLFQKENRQQRRPCTNHIMERYHKQSSSKSHARLSGHHFEQFKTAEESNLPPLPSQRFAHQEQTVPDDDQPISLEDRKVLIREKLDNLKTMFEEEART